MSRKLHIGGRDVRKGWEIFNISQGDNVDHCGNANDLSRFEDNTFKTIYASHIFMPPIYWSILTIKMKLIPYWLSGLEY